MRLRGKIIAHQPSWISHDRTPDIVMLANCFLLHVYEIDDEFQVMLMYRNVSGSTREKSRAKKTVTKNVQRSAKKVFMKDLQFAHEALRFCRIVLFDEKQPDTPILGHDIKGGTIPTCCIGVSSRSEITKEAFRVLSNCGSVLRRFYTLCGSQNDLRCRC